MKEIVILYERKSYYVKVNVILCEGQCHRNAMSNVNAWHYWLPIVFGQ